MLKESKSLLEATEKLNSRLNDLSRNVETNIFLDEIILLLESYTQKCENILRGIILAGQGKPSSIFLSPIALNRVVNLAAEKGTELLFGKDVSKYYQTAETKLLVVGMEIVILSKIAIPSKENSGLFYKIEPLQMFKEDKFFIELQTEGTVFFVNNLKGNFIELNFFEISMCKKYN